MLKTERIRTNPLMRSDRYQKDIHSEYHWIPYPVSVRFLHTVSIPSNVPKMHQNKHSRPVQDTPIAQK